MRSAIVSALPPVAQPFQTLTNGSPVRPSSLTRVSASPPSRLPPKANCGLVPPDAGVGEGERGWRATRLLPARHAVGAAERVHADADDGDARRWSLMRCRPRRGAEGEGDDVGAVGGVVNGTTTSSIGWPISSSSGSAVVSRDSTITSPASST